MPFLPPTPMDLTTRERAEALLLKAARTYGVPARRDDVQRAVSDAQHGTAFAEWAITHLTPDTLVTPDELALYTALDRSGEVDRLAALHDLGEAPEVDEGSLRIAVDELRRSTQSIARQTESLRQQQAALQRMVKKEADNEARRRDLEASRRRKHDMRYRELLADVAEVSQGIEFKMSDLEDQAKDASPGLDDAVKAAFQSDDKLLSGLQKLGWELKQEDPEEAKDVEKLRETCMRLIKTTVETVRARLDTVFLDSLSSSGSNSSGDRHVTQADVKALEEEVESLYSEILPVAQMSVEQQHLEPALQSVSASSGQGLNRSAVAVTYVDECLDYLLDRIIRLNERVEMYKSHQDAAAALAAIAKEELAVDTTRPKQPPKPAMPASPVRNPSPVRKRANTANSRARRRSSGIPEAPPLEALLESLGLSLPVLETDDSTAQIAAIANLLAERRRKADDVAISAQENFESTVMGHLDDARCAVQLLRDSILAETPFGEVQLVDQDVEASITVLAQEVDKAKAQLAEAEENRPSGRSERRAEILRRWG
ncbi:hypothetical protein HJFPF1_02590 [Paramyrothecium foliicola]|nr:hypothetical protein HJFPF1_02590 [Paramyrothecium foliicola]